MIGHAEERDRLYYLERSSEKLNNVYQSSLFVLTQSSISNKEQIWLHHFHLGHPSFSVLRTMFPLLFKFIDVDSFHCDVCEFAKHHRVSFPLSNKKCSIPFTLVHSNIWGPARVPNISRARWFVSFIDDCKRMSWIFLLKQKSKVSNVFPIFNNMIKNQFGICIKRVRSNNAREYFNQTLSPHFHKGIIHESSCVDTPQKNDVAERKKLASSCNHTSLIISQTCTKIFLGQGTPYGYTLE